jgi:AGCS family alanine or glycine:cation symporter
MTLEAIVNQLKEFVWGPVSLVFLVGTGVYLSYRVGFIQFTKFTTVIKHTLGRVFEKNNNKGEVTPFQAMTTALSATVGTGNIAGVTGAIAIGGPGAVFWMWISAIFGMITKYAEVFLAVKYRERNKYGDWVGGPMYYIKNGLGDKYNWLAVLFCLFGALAAFGIGNMTQVNTIASSINTALQSYGIEIMNASFTVMNQVVPVSSLIVGTIVAGLIGLVLFGGIQRIGKVAELLVPFMSILYIVCGLIVVVCNIQFVPNVIALIFKGAFNAQAAVGGAVGITIMTTIQRGVGRGVFSNEAGLGSAPMGHASTSETNPVKQGLYGIFEVFADTLVICSLTAFILLCGYYSGVDIVWGQGAGAELISASFSTVFGSHMGALLVAVCISLFAFSTILSWSLYGTRCFEYLFKSKAVKMYQIAFLIVIVIGACLKLSLVWDIADALNGMMILPNLVALILLSPVVIKATNDYFR